jgi:hypothetical protein
VSVSIAFLYVPYTFPSMTQLYVDTIKGKLTNSPPSFEKYKIIVGEFVNLPFIVSTYNCVIEGKVYGTYRKAIETDTITKALSRLGFNADIYTDGELIAGTQAQTGFDDLELVEIKTDEKNKD